MAKLLAALQRCNVGFSSRISDSPRMLTRLQWDQELASNWHQGHPLKGSTGSCQNETLPILPHETVLEASMTAVDQSRDDRAAEREPCLSGIVIFWPSSLLFLMAVFR
jgi:hypothetical protein